MTSTYAAPNARTTSSAADAALLIGRIVLVAMFIFSGIGKFADISGTAAYIASKGLPMPQVLAVLAGLAELGGGLLIVVGWQARVVAVGLMIFTLLAGCFFHDFWQLPDGMERLNTMIHFMKNVSIAGAFLMLAGAGAGRYSLDGRLR